MKPLSSSQGKGIYITDTFPLDEQCVVSRYIGNPLLVNGKKVDLRIYVLMTSVDPLWIYLYQEGLVRFASEEYSDSIDNKFSHLTNYSLNKKNDRPTDSSSDQCLKWTLTNWSKKLESIGIDMNLLWSKIYDINLYRSSYSECHLENCFLEQQCFWTVRVWHYGW